MWINEQIDPYFSVLI